MIARSIFSRCIDYIKQLITLLINVPNLLKKQFFIQKQNLNKLNYNLKNFAETNIKLGLYHLNNQNYNDAIFRFILVDKFLRPADPSINYWLGWSYFLKQNYQKAASRLEKGKSEDKIGLLEFIKNINNVTKVPDEIYSIYRGMVLEKIIDKFFDQNHNLPRDLVIQLTRVINKLPEKYSMLELGSNIGLVGQEIQKRLPGGFFLTGVESSAEMIKLQEKCGYSKIYGEIINLPIENYLDNNKNKKYDIILSLNGFASSLNLINIFNKIYYNLFPEGYFAFAFRVNKGKNFSREYLEFAYNEDYVQQISKQCGFKVVSNSSWGPTKQESYFILICQKYTKK